MFGRSRVFAAGSALHDDPRRLAKAYSAYAADQRAYDALLARSDQFLDSIGVQRTAIEGAKLTQTMQEPVTG